MKLSLTKLKAAHRENLALLSAQALLGRNPAPEEALSFACLLEINHNNLDELLVFIKESEEFALNWSTAIAVSDTNLSNLTARQLAILRQLQSAYTIIYK